jgi:pre-mRNA-processing factor 6
MSGFGPKSANTYSVPIPQNYIAGIGRGAMGFTTRSDIGPARPAAGVAPTIDPLFGQAPVGYVAGRGRGMGELARNQGELSEKQVQEDGDRGDYSESNYDEFAGYGGALFSSAGTPYEEDDAEADQIYESVNEFMEGRHKRRREQQQLDAQRNHKAARLTIADQFADLKRELATVSTAEWDSIPEVGDRSLKLKQKTKKETYLPMPDYMLESASQRGGVFTQQVDPLVQKSGGIDTPGGASTVTGMAEARGAVLTLRLDKMSDSVSGQTVVDPKGYLTDLNSIRINTDAEVTDIKKAELLLHSVTSTNPKHAPGWVAAARVQEFAGRLVQARKIIRQGCEACPDSEDVWLEAARLHTCDNAKVILANAVRHIPSSVKLWLAAADLETSSNQKKVVLRRALEFIPNSVQLWKTAIELESVADAKIMLARAVECVPQSIEMWLALAKLETYENARRVLNQAREALPTEPLTWITAARLEEAHGSGFDIINRIIEKMIASLTQYEVVIGREQWLKEAEQCEQANALLTCAAIVRNTIHLNVEEEDRLATWTDGSYFLYILHLVINIYCYLL